MKIKKYLAILLSSAMVLQMSVMAFAYDDQPDDIKDDYHLVGSDESGYGVSGYAEPGSGGSGSNDSGSVGNVPEGDDIKDDLSSVGDDTGTSSGYKEEPGEQEYKYPDAKEISYQFYEDDSGEISEIDGGDVTKKEDSSGCTYTAEAKNGFEFQEFIYEKTYPSEDDEYDFGWSYETSVTINFPINYMNAYFIRYITSQPEEPVEEAKEPEQQQEEPSEPHEPSAPEPQVSIVSTAAGNALPTTALGNAIASTKSVSLDLYNVEPAQYVNYFTAVISSVPQNGQAVIALNKESCLNKKIVDEIAARSDVTVNIIYKDKAGITKLIVIPAGANLSSLVDANGYIGFEALAATFGEKVLQ
jgi:hypothetical protein